MVAILNSAILNSANLDSASGILEFRHLVFFSQIHPKAISFHFDSDIKLIQFDSNSFILTQLDDGSHLEFCHFEFGYFAISHL